MTQSPPFPLGVSVGNPDASSASAEAAFEARYNAFVTTMGVAAQYNLDYIDQTLPINKWVTNATYSADSSAASVATEGLTPVISLPMVSTAAGSPSADQMYKNFASGAYDNVLTGMVNAWAKDGFTTQFWRPGWEMNIGGALSYAGDTTAQQADWVAAFQHIYTVLHQAGAADGVNVQVVWNPGIINYSNVGVATQTVYPGNSYVDVVAADMYSDISPYGAPNKIYDWSTGTIAANLQTWAANPVNLVHYWTYPAATQYALDSSVGHSFTLQNLIDFAKAQGKPFAIGEAGAGNTSDGANVPDDPAFPQWLASTLATAGVPIDFVNIYDSNGNGNYEFSQPSDNKPLEAAAWKQYFGVAPVAATAATTAAGTSAAITSDTIHLQVSEDAWMGDANYTVSIDGTLIGGVRTATASHAAGASNDVTITGNWGPGEHTIGVSFINDAYGGSPSTDRNLYVSAVSYDGSPASGTPAALLSNLTANFAVAPPAVNTAFTLNMTEDAWRGDAQYSVAVDGVTVTGLPATVTTLNSSGSVQAVAFNALLSVGTHDLAISFLNDAYGGSASADRNLYVKEIDVNGRALTNGSASLLGNATDHFQFVVPASS